jgi:Predicted symporter
MHQMPIPALQQLNGISLFQWLPSCSQAFFTQNICCRSKNGTFSGLSFYIICIFILDVDLHFIHIWGIEFLLNVAIMFGVSYFYPNQKSLDPGDINLLDLTEWKHTKKLSIGFCVVTLLIYIVLGQAG